MAPRKVRLVVGMIKGMDTRRAEAVLRQASRRAYHPVLKLLRSAIANVAENARLTSGNFYIKDIRVDPGPMSKRFRPRAFGRAAPIRRRTSHVSLILATKESGEVRVARGAPKEEPVIRNLRPEDLREETRAQERRERAQPVNAPKPKSSNVIRRIFQRKAI